jgi:hypothetical protein
LHRDDPAQTRDEPAKPGLTTNDILEGRPVPTTAKHLHRDLLSIALGRPDLGGGTVAEVADPPVWPSLRANPDHGTALP